MNRAATEDVRSLVWPVVSRVLRPGPAPSARAAAVVALLDDWVRRDAPRLDADDDGNYDEAGPGDHGRGLAADRRGGDAPGVRRSARRPRRRPRPRRALGRVLRGQGPAHAARRARSNGPFNLRYCGGGSLAACRASLWARSTRSRRARRAARRPIRRPGAAHAARTGFVPGLIPDTFRGHEPPDLPAGARARAAWPLRPDPHVRLSVRGRRRGPRTTIPAWRASAPKIEQQEALDRNRGAHSVTLEPRMGRPSSTPARRSPGARRPPAGRFGISLVDLATVCELLAGDLPEPRIPSTQAAVRPRD